MKGVGPLATMMTKQSINRGVDMTLQQGFMQEADMAYMLSWSDDRKEGLRRFQSVASRTSRTIVKDVRAVT